MLSSMLSLLLNQGATRALPAVLMHPTGRPAGNTLVRNGGAEPVSCWAWHGMARWSQVTTKQRVRRWVDLAICRKKHVRGATKKS